MIKLGKMYGNLMVDVQMRNEKLLQRARRIVAQVGQVDDVQAAEAHARLDAADGFLRKVID